MTRIIAHRGNSRVAPQNTLAALEAAWRAGADAIEIDIQPLADGTAAVIHDETVDGTTDGSGPVSDFGPRELAFLDAGSWFSPAFAGQRVPLLGDVLDFLAGREGIDLLLEVKGDWDRPALRTALTDILRAGLGERVIVQSFSRVTLAGARDLAPDLRRELIVKDLPVDIAEAVGDLGVGGINPSGTALLEGPGFVAQMHAAGLRVSSWTLDKPDHWRRALELGIDGIITNRPEMLLGFRAARA